MAGIIGPELPASSLRIVFGATGIAKKVLKIYILYVPNTTVAAIIKTAFELSPSLKMVVA
jgi:hypothetical protein